ncbi:(R)-specific enoyl-CoA hydratase [Planococcus massiliensis]|uniref:(R)-specific enoyl-CoA hydratase n=1 Tax=Planococcus massiliensis TaxID=1499687 RepID=A0A098EPI5_9BACL|nr:MULTISPECIES: MaoC/PaaZ C-terminal domain-containing protein [Planococcus]MCJ1908606.1 enoyl-CoA hydratase [Planococcus ruber]CEG23221.1 (R)-specific enoyl-CoA hydratase [Planococcus massiliensis]
MLGKKRELGRKIEDLKIGENLQLTETVEDKDLLLYLGLTNDGNPLYIQHDFAAQTAFEKPVVPTIMLTGIITSAISKYLPGPGSYINEQQIKFHRPVYHYSTFHFSLELVKIDVEGNEVTIKVEASDEKGNLLISGTVLVNPPKLESQLASH